MENTPNRRGKAKGITLVQKVISELETLEIGETMRKNYIVFKYWDRTDEYTKRCFDMSFFKAKNEMNGKDFIQHCGIITRIK